MSIAHTCSREFLRVTVQLEIAIDVDYVAAIATRTGRSVDVILREVAGDLEGRAFDTARCRDGVDRVTSHVVINTGAESSS